MPKHVLIYPADALGCGMYRMIWPGKAAAYKGRPVTVQPKSPHIIVNKKVNPPVALDIQTGNADVVVFQRPANYQISQLIPILQRRGVAVVIDMDDDLTCIHPRNPAHKSYNPKNSPLKNHEWARKACELADLVTVTTPALAERYAPHGRFAIVPNHIPASYLAIPREPYNPEKRPVVGWAGWVRTHPEDLYVTSGMINQALINTGARFMSIGDKAMYTALRVRPRPDYIHRGFVGIYEYPSELIKLDVGLVPLQNSPFNRAKSWLKALEYASLGVVPVVSPTPDNMRLVEMGAALVANNPKEWKTVVEDILLDHEKRIEMSQHCRKVAAGLTIEDNTHLWWDAWSGAARRTNLLSLV